MATVLKEFEFTTQRKYDLHQYADGRIYRFIRGEDFDCEVPIFRNYIRTFSLRNGLDFKSNRDPFDHNAVVVQMRRPKTKARSLEKRRTKP